MSDSGELAAWMEGALTKVTADVARARSLVSDAMGQLLVTFRELSQHLTDERRHYEAAIETITGRGSDQGLVRVMREILQRFVDDIVTISRGSVRILMEVESLRGHADEVATRGHRIEKIAQATRVISLNAGIEARRVGSAGSVFRVVADEIKTLANETGELSKAIRAAIARQAESLASAHDAATQLAASDLEVAVEGHRNLGATIERLERVSATSLQALARIQLDLDNAIRALQFEDMLTQLLDSIADKLGAIRTVCRQAAAGADRSALPASIAATEARLGRDAVAQRNLDVGAVELF